MTTIEEAQALVLNAVSQLPEKQLKACDAVGHILAEDITADVDSPPHRKSLVDGYAVRADDLSSGNATLTVIEEVFAGQLPTQSIAGGQATRIMTGAPVPDGSDAVAMVEDTSDVDNASDKVNVAATLKPGQHIQEQGCIMRAGETVLQKGHRIRPIEIGLLCEVGRTTVPVFELPNVAILPTGDELVDASTVPGPGQIRNTNGPMLHALAAESGAIATTLGIGRDDIPALRQMIQAGLRDSDILVLSGGVSMGQKDFVPGVLQDLDVKTIFHRVQLRPGKPIWFGVWNDKTLVFGLPGNPVSSLVCFHLFVKLAVFAMQGRRRPASHMSFRLQEAFTLAGNRPTYFPARYTESGAIKMLSWKGSADQRTLCEADCLAFFPKSGRYEKAAEIQALPLTTF